jgi:hypothetical protein
MSNFTSQQLVSIGIKRLNPTDTTTDTKYDNDYLFEQLNDLVNEKFKSWYCGQFYRLGKDTVLKLASVARSDGKQPQKLFSYLIKKS